MRASTTSCTKCARSATWSDRGCRSGKAVFKERPSSPSRFGRLASQDQCCAWPCDVRTKYDAGAVSAAIWNVICLLQTDGRVAVLAQVRLAPDSDRKADIPASPSRADGEREPTPGACTPA